MNKNKVWIRIIAIPLLITFLSQDIVFAQGGLAEISVPKSLASSQDSYNAPLRNTQDAIRNTIINIQDAHASLSAQESIVSILDSLVTNYDLSVVAIEGSSGYIDTSLLKTFPNQAVRNSAAGDLMARGLMSAAEFFSITSSKHIALYGIEDRAIYKKNAQEFRRIYEMNESVKKDIDGLLYAVKSLKDKIYTPELKELDDSLASGGSDPKAFKERWQSIKAHAVRAGVDYRSYASLSKFVNSLELEKVIDFDKANKERECLIDELSKEADRKGLEELVLKSVDFKTGRISAGDFYLFLADISRKRRADPAKYKNLTAYTDYIALYESIDLVSIFEEAKEFETAVREKLFVNDDQRKLYRLSRYASLIKDLFEIKLTDGDLGYLKDDMSLFGSVDEIESFIKGVSSKYAIRRARYYDLNRILCDIPEALKFYETARMRDSVILENTITRMKQEGRNVAALVTGGYHTKGLTKLLKDKYTSYLVILPKFDSSRGERPYVTILTNRKDRYESVLKSGQYYLATAAYFDADPSVSEEARLARYGEDFKAVLTAAAADIDDKTFRDARIRGIVYEWSANYRAFYEDFAGKNPGRLSEVRDPARVDEFLNSLLTYLQVKQPQQESKADFLVIGSSGFLGETVLTQLSKKHTTRGTYYTTKQGDRLQLNTANRRQVLELFKSIRPKVVVHTAALADMDYCEEHGAEARKINVIGTRNVALACKAIGAKMVYISTDQVFDGNNGPYSEEDAPSPINVYGRTKLESEEVVKDLLDNYLIIRAPLILGLRSRFVKGLLKTFKAGGEAKLPVDIYTNPVAVESLTEIIEKLVSKGKTGIYHVGGAEYLNRYELADRLAGILKLDKLRLIACNSEDTQGKARRLKKGGLRTDKLRRELGLEEDIRWFAGQGEASGEKTHTARPQTSGIKVPKEISDLYDIIKPYTTGGSSAETLLARDKHGRTVIVKHSAWAGVGSNGIPWLRAQYKRLKELKQSLDPEGAAMIPEVYEYHETKDLAFYSMQYLEGGKPLPFYFLEHTSGGAQPFMDDLESIIDQFCRHIYSQGNLEVPQDYVQKVHIARMDYRFGLLTKRDGDVYDKLISGRPFAIENARYDDVSYMFEELEKAPIIRINGVDYTNLPRLLSEVKTDHELIEKLKPRSILKYAHGDMLLRNIMKMSDGSFRLFDVRGVDLPGNSPSRIDLTYELGKMLHSFLLEIVRNDLFDMKVRRDGGTFNFDIKYRTSNSAVANFLEVRRRLPEMLRNQPRLMELLKDEPMWLEKALFAEATHFIADAPNRLSQDPSGAHTLAYYAIGTQLLHELLKTYKPLAISVDLGGTKIASEAFDTAGKAIEGSYSEIPTEAVGGRDVIIDNIIKQILYAAGKSGADISRISGISISSPGPLNPTNGIVESSINLPGFTNLNLKKAIEDELQKLHGRKIDVFVQHDAAAAALGEATSGAGRGLKDFHFMTISTGIGSGIIRAGKIYYGEDGTKFDIGETGFMKGIDPDRPECNLMDIASGLAIARDAKSAVIAGENTRILAFAKDGAIDNITAETVGIAARQGDQVAIEIVKRAAGYIGIRLARLIDEYGEKNFILGGGVTKIGDIFIDEIKRTVKKERPEFDINGIRTADLGARAGMLGAIASIPGFLASPKAAPTEEFTKLLVIDSASEITGVNLRSAERAVVDEIATEIKKEIEADPSRHIVQILKAVKVKTGTLAQQAIDKLTADINNPDGEFDYQNLAYQAVVSIVRAWPKKHWHAHPGESIHDGFNWNEMALYKKELFEEFRKAVEKMVPDDANKRTQIIHILQSRRNKGLLWHELDNEARHIILDLFSKGGLKRDVGVYDLASWQRMMTHIALQHFSDGVTDLRLQINISKKFEPDRTKLVGAVIDGFKKAEELAEKKYGRKFTARLVASFARQDIKNTPEYVNAIVDELIAMRQENDEYKDRIIGVDISGAEAIIDTRINTHFRKTSDYKAILEKASVSGMIVMSHLGDMGNTHKATDKMPKREGVELDVSKELAGIADREELVREHLRFVEDGVKSSGLINAVLHGTIVAPQGSVITKGPKKGNSFAGQAVESPENIAKIEELLQYMRQKGIEIMTCPTANTNSSKIAMYKGHPLHQWLAEGNKVSINVDDFYWGNVRSTLSDDITKMMLAAPLDSKAVMLTPEFARKISVASDMTGKAASVSGEKAYPAEESAKKEEERKEASKRLKKVIAGTVIFIGIVVIANWAAAAYGIFGGRSLLGLYIAAYDYSHLSAGLVAGLTAAVEGAVAERVGHYLAREKKEKVRKSIFWVIIFGNIIFRFAVLGPTASLIDHVIEQVVPIGGAGQATVMTRAAISLIHGVFLASVANFFIPFLSFKAEARFREKEGKIAEAKELREKYAAGKQFRRVLDSIKLRIAPVIVQHDVIQNIFSYELAYKILSRFGFGFVNSTFRGWITNKSRYVSVRPTSVLIVTLASAFISFKWGSWSLGLAAIGTEVAIVTISWLMKRHMLNKSYKECLGKFSGGNFIQDSGDAKEYMLDAIARWRGEKRSGPFVMAIDGNSGSLKTTTAQELKSALELAGQKAEVIRVDWFLRDRYNDRYPEYADEMGKTGTSVNWKSISLREKKFEEDVLEKLRRFRKSGEQEIKLDLRGLYAEGGGGTLSLEQTIKITRDTVIIIEGNYALQKKWSDCYDLKALMLAKPAVTARRRTSRDSKKAPKGFVKEVLERISLPSYFNYLISDEIIKPDIVAVTDSWKRTKPGKSGDKGYPAGYNDGFYMSEKSPLKSRLHSYDGITIRDNSRVEVRADSSGKVHELADLISVALLNVSRIVPQRGPPLPVHVLPRKPQKIVKHIEYNEPEARAEPHLMLDQNFIETLLKYRNMYPRAIPWIVAEKLAHEFTHSNTMGDDEKEAKEERDVILHADLPFYRLLCEQPELKAEVDRFFDETGTKFGTKRFVKLFMAVHKDDPPQALREAVERFVDSFYSFSFKFHTAEHEEWAPADGLNGKILVNRRTGRIKYGAQDAVVSNNFDLLLVRHGQTKGNLIDEFVQGNVDEEINQLTEFGRAGAAKAAEQLFAKLERKILSGEEVVVMTSKLGRSKETASYFVNLVRERTGKVLAVIEEELANERYCGIWENKTRAELSAKEGEMLDKYRNGLDATVRPRNGESYLDLLLRSRKLVEKINERHYGKTVVLFGHATHIGAIRAVLGDRELNDAGGELDWRSKALPNAGILFVPRAGTSGSGVKSYPAQRGSLKYIIGVPRNSVPVLERPVLAREIDRIFSGSAEIYVMESSNPDELTAEANRRGIKYGAILDIGSNPDIQKTITHLQALADKAFREAHADIAIINASNVGSMALSDLAAKVAEIERLLPGTAPLSIEALKADLQRRTRVIGAGFAHVNSAALNSLFDKREKAVSITTQGVVESGMLYSLREKIQSRWQKMGISDKKDDPIKEVVAITDPGVKNDDAAKRYISAIGLEGYVDYVFARSPEEVRSLSTLCGGTAGRIGLRVKKGEINEYESLRSSIPSLVILELGDINGAFVDTNSYEALFELFAVGELQNIPGVSKDETRRIFIYIPKAVPIDYDKEVREHQRALRAILSAA